MGANVAVAQNAHEAFYMYWYRVPSCDNVYLTKMSLVVKWKIRKID